MCRRVFLSVYLYIWRSEDDFVCHFSGAFQLFFWDSLSLTAGSRFQGSSALPLLCTVPVSPHMAFPIGSGAVTQALLLTQKVFHQPAIPPALILYLYSTCVLIDTMKSRSELHNLVSQHKLTFRKFPTAENSRFLG